MIILLTIGILVGLIISVGLFFYFVSWIEDTFQINFAVIFVGFAFIMTMFYLSYITADAIINE